MSTPSSTPIPSSPSKKYTHKPFYGLNKKTSARNSSNNSSKTTTSDLASNANKHGSNGSTKAQQAQREQERLHLINNDKKNELNALQHQQQVDEADRLFDRSSSSAPSTHGGEEEQPQPQGNYLGQVNTNPGFSGHYLQGHQQQDDYNNHHMNVLPTPRSAATAYNNNHNTVAAAVANAITTPQISGRQHILYMSRYYQNLPYIQNCLAQDLHQVLGMDFRVMDAGITLVPFPSYAIYNEMFNFSQADYEKFYLDENKVPVETCNIFVGQLPLVHQPGIDHTGSVYYLRWLISLSGVKPLKAEVKRGNNKKASIGIVTVPKSEADKIIAFLHKRALITQTGVYIATTREQIKILHAFCFDMLKFKDDARFQHRPYTPLTVSHEIAAEQYVRNSRKPEGYNPLCPGCEAERDRLCPLEIRYDSEERPSPFGFVYTHYLPVVTNAMVTPDQQMATHAHISDYVLNNVVPEGERWLYANVKPNTVRITNEKAWKFWNQRGGSPAAVQMHHHECVCDAHRQQQQQSQGYNNNNYYYHHH